MKQHDQNCFITLTYDEDHVPLRSDPENTDYAKGTLQMKDLQNFLKGLRRKLNEIPKEKRTGRKRYYSKEDPEFRNFRYFACGEYGDNSGRPHYHICLFGYMPADIERYASSELGFDYFTSKELNDIWKKGFVVVADATWETAAYTARYVLKKVTNKEMDFYLENNVDPPFLNMSRRPGIGYNYYEGHKKCYATISKTYLKTPNGPKPIGSIRYFDEKLKVDDPFTYDYLHDQRAKTNKDRQKFKNKLTTKDYLAQLETEDELLQMRMKRLRRKGGEHYQKEGTSWIRQEDF